MCVSATRILRVRRLKPCGDCSPRFCRGPSGVPATSAEATTATSSLATVCARRACLLPRLRRTPLGRATCLASTARSSRHSPRRSGGATNTIDCWERERFAGVISHVEVNHASEVSSATESRRCRALRQAWQDEPEQAQRRIEKCMYKSMSEEQLDERGAAL